MRSAHVWRDNRLNRWRSEAGMQTLVTSPCAQVHRVTRKPSCVAVYASGVRARWCIDVEYGHKQTATSLLQEWVADVGSRAGLTHTNTRLSSGSVGVAESRLELEVTFSSLSEWEQFLASIPAKEHRAWSQRMQGMIVGGSPRWELYRAVLAFPDEQEQATAAVVGAAGRPFLAFPTMPQLPSRAGNAVTAIGAANEGSAGVATNPSGVRDSGLSIIDNLQDAEVVLDWKGEPMKINPGDKLPFKFL